MFFITLPPLAQFAFFLSSPPPKEAVFWLGIQVLTTSVDKSMMSPMHFQTPTTFQGLDAVTAADRPIQRRD